MGCSGARGRAVDVGPAPAGPFAGCPAAEPAVTSAESTRAAAIVVFTLRERIGMPRTSGGVLCRSRLARAYLISISNGCEPVAVDLAGLGVPEAGEAVVCGRL